VRNGDAGTLAGVVAGPAADGHEAVALVLLIQRHRVHDVVVLGVGLDLVIEDGIESVVLQRLEEVVHDVCAAQTGRHDERLGEAQLDGLRTDELVRARANQGPGKRVGLLDGEGLEQLIDLHVDVLSSSAPRSGLLRSGQDRPRRRRSGTGGISATVEAV
jgi:hypothetical protein